MSKDYSLSLRGEAFNSLCADFDTTLRDVLAGMIETEQNTGEINIKVKITLTDDSAPDYTVAGGHQTREVTKPKFDHTVAYVIQRKEKKSGSFSGNFELVFDKASGQYFYRDIDNGQTTLFDGDGDSADFANTQYDVVDEGPRGLPAAPESSVIDGEEVGPADAEDAAPDAAGEFEEKAIDPAHDPSKPFGWLRQFIGETMNVTEAMGNYTVRTQGNKVVLSSATSPENPFYCSAEKLSPHVGHAVVCVGYGDDEIVNISIECEDCSEVLFDIDSPHVGMEDAAEEEASGEEEPTEETDATDAAAEEEPATEEPADENEPNGYEYDEPEA